MTGGRTIDQLIDAYSLSREEIEAALGYAVKAVRAQQKKRSTSLLKDEREWEVIIHTQESLDFLAHLRAETLADIDAGDIEDGGFGQR